MSKELEALEALESLMKDYYEMCLDTGNNDDEYQKNNLTSEYHIIENALERLEQQDSVLKILKEVIEFAQIVPHIEPNKDNGFDIVSAAAINVQRDIENRERELLRQWVLETCFPKELKALEIIIEKNVDFKTLKEAFIFKGNNKEQCEMYNLNQWSWVFQLSHPDCVDTNREKTPHLTQEEFDLLKEVLL